MLSPYFFLLLAIYVVNACSLIFCTGAFAEPSSNPQIVVAPISTDEWRGFLGDVITKKLSDSERLTLLEKYAVDAMNQVQNTKFNNNDRASIENVFRLTIRGYALSWYVIEATQNRQSGKWIKERETIHGVRSQISPIIGSQVIDKSFENLTEILQPNTSGSVYYGSGGFKYKISDEFQKITIDRWNYDIPAKSKEMIKVKNYEFGNDVSNTLFKMCIPDNKNSWNDRRQCNTDEYGTKFLNDFKYGNIENGIEVTIGEKGDLLAINSTFPLAKAFELKDILTEKYGNSSYVKSDDYKSINRECANAPYLTTHYFWKDVNGTVIQLDTTQFSIGSYKNCEFFGRITIMSKQFIDNIKDMLIKFNEQKKQEKEKEKKKAIDNL